jgi:hypothetical protein
MRRIMQLLKTTTLCVVLIVAGPDALPGWA